jgi:sporulation protein YlmC with PRC-barrel domain
MSPVRVFADFHNADRQGRLRLNCVGSIEDLARQNIELHEGRSLTLYSEDLEVEGVVQYSQEENLWVVAIDWNNIKQIDDLVIQALL